MALGDKLRVMISSTVKDLGPEREAVETAIAGFRFRRYRSEAMPSAHRPSREVCDDMAGTCDLMVLILGGRYGWTIPDLEISVTEREFDVARKANRRKILAFEKKLENREERQQLFIQKVKDFTDGYFVASFESAEELKEQVEEAMAEWISSHLVEAKEAQSAATTTSVSASEEMKEAERLMPKLIATMRQDVSGDPTGLVSELVVLPNQRVGYAFPRRHFQYFEDEHENLGLMIDWLVGSGLIVNESRRNLSVYRLTRDFGRWLRESDSTTPDEPEHTIWIEDEVFFRGWDRVAWEIRMRPVDPGVVSTITDVRAKLWPRAKPAYMPEQWTRTKLAVPSRIGGGREYEATTFEFQPTAKMRTLCSAADAEDPTGQFEMLAEVDYQTEGDQARTLHVTAVSVVRRHQAPAPIDVRWAGGTTSQWQNGTTRKLVITFRGEGHAEITDIRAWMTHRDDPDTRYPATHQAQLPDVLGEGKRSLDETVNFLTKRIPEELRGERDTPKNLITLHAEVEYVERDGNLGTKAARPFQLT